MTPFTGDKCLLFNERIVNKKSFWSAVASVARHRFQFLIVTDIQSAAEVGALQNFIASENK
jgi:hypothetical protein